MSAFLASQLTPTALELELPPPRLLVRFESIEAAVDEQAREAASLAAARGAKARILQNSDETAMWDAHDRRPWEGRGAIVKVSLLVSDLADTLTWLAEAREIQSLVSAFISSQLTPTALELELPPPRVLIRFESVEAAVDEQAREAVSLAAARGAKARILQDSSEAAIWDAHDRRPWERRGAIVKVSLLVGDLAETLTWLAEAAGIDGCEVTGRAGLGALLIRVDGDTDAQARLLTELRQRIPVGRGNAVVLRGSRELKARVDVWGPIGDGLDLMRAVKQRFDPSGILNPGRGPGGI